jgi:uncharacterized protein YgiM (DUF1202 family)
MGPEPATHGGSVLAAIVRRVVPWLSLIVVVTLVWTWVGEYRSAVGEREQSEPSAPYVRVLNDGLNLRAEPMTTATVLKTLKKDQRLVLLEKRSSWYKVRDDTGTEGWVAAGGRYTELVEP